MIIARAQKRQTRHFHGSQQSSAVGRLVIEYSTPGASRMSGLLTVQSVRFTDVSLYEISLNSSRCRARILALKNSTL